MRGSVKKRGSSWSVVFDLGRDPITGKRLQKKKGGFKTKKEAEKFLTEQLTSLEKGTYIEPSTMKFGEYLDYWIKNYAEPNSSPTTLEGYLYIINKHVKPSLGNIDLSKLLPLHLQTYYTEKLGNGRRDGQGGLSARSVLHHHRVISKALNDALKWQFVVRNVAQAVNPPKAKKQEMKTLDPEQVATLLEYAKNTPYYGIIYAAIHTGMRRGELLGLRWQDVDMKNKVIQVRQSIQHITGAGLITKEPKNGKSRTVTMTESLIQMLRQHKTAQSKNKLLLGEEYNDRDLVFSQANGKPIFPTDLTKAYNKLFKTSGIPHVRFHDLRHTHATLLLQQGIHPKIVSERLGHSTIGITLDTYTHVLPNMQKEAADRFDQLLQSKEK